MTTTEDRRAAASHVLSAKTLTDVQLPDADATTTVRRLRRLLHPDGLAGDDAAWRALDALASPHVVAAPAPPAGPSDDAPLELRVGKRCYTLGALLTRGDLSDLYAAGPGQVAKVSGPADADLLEREAATLRAIHAPDDHDGPRARLRRLVPALVDTFALHGPDGTRRVNVLERADGCVDLRDVRAAYPNGVDYRDAAWMMRRLLAALGTTHFRGYVHGAVLPVHVMINADNHGAALVDWCYAVKTGEPAHAIVAARTGWYPPEVLAKRPLTPATDVYMAGMCYAYLLGDTTTGEILRPAADTPREIQAFVRSMLIEAPFRRPSDAWALHEQLGDVMRELCGPPTFRPFVMPPRRATT